MPHKPSGGASNYPGVSTYQAPGATGFGMSSYEESEFGKYGAGSVKGSTLPTTSGTADLASLKHDSKGGYNMQPMGGSGGYTFMQVGDSRYVSLICGPQGRSGGGGKSPWVLSVIT